jgi:putative peptide zinc metalloprotease protein
LLSLIVHEFGHSSACARYGAQPSDIGFAVYLIYPAFYSDVSSAWRLRRWQRVVVDLGGNYFQFLAGSCFIFAFYGTHWDAFRLAVLMIVSTALFSLNPIFKFDGYWVLADFLGVTNLASQPARIGTFFYNRMLRRATKPLPWPTRVASVLIIYSVISMIVWAVFFWHVAPMLWRRVISLSHSISIIRVYLESGHPPPWMEFRSFLISMFFLVISVAMLWQMAKRVANAVSRWSPYFLKKLTERHSLAQPESVRPKL